MAGRLRLFLLLAISSCTVASKGVNISIYLLSVDEFNEIKAGYQDVLTDEVNIYCADNCTAAFKSNLTVELTDVIDAKPNVNVTIMVYNEDREMLSIKHTENMIESRRPQINTRTKQQITAANHKLYGIAPDNPTNWIIIAVFSIFTLALLLAAVYLSKHKVNHADEHYQAIKERQNSADGEIAA